MISPESPLKQRIHALGERLDSHRKRQQEQHPGLTLTAKEKPIHDQGLVTVLRQVHDELDAAVLEAYGWGDCSGDHRSPLAPIPHRRLMRTFSSSPAPMTMAVNFSIMKSTCYSRFRPPWP